MESKYTRQEDLSSIPAVYTQTYTYGNSGDPDQLTGCGGQSLSYDNEGNLTAYNGWTYSWSNGNLTGATNSGLGNTASYTYRYDGIRTGKTVNGVTTTYTLDGNTIVGETDGTNTIQYIYDENNNPVYMVYNGVKLFYERNLQGDITGIIDFGHTRLVTYSYDTWGNLTQIGGPEAGTLGLANSLRYRGYYYDTETGLYYLQSRYYDPGLGRFISKDDPIFHEGDTGVAANLYTYCRNDPVMYVDPTGYSYWYYISSKTVNLIIAKLMIIGASTAFAGVITAIIPPPVGPFLAAFFGTFTWFSGTVAGILAYYNAAGRGIKVYVLTIFGRGVRITRIASQ